MKKYPEYKNIFITNLRDNNAYIFNGHKFVVISKDEVLDELITYHVNEIENNIDEYKNNISKF
jgi:uncharacterized protein YlzI (FlbEa/FlbD family)